MQQIDLNQLMAEGHCSPGIAKRLAHVGVEATWPKLTYDGFGSLGNGGWVKEIQGEHAEFYPAVNFYEAYMLLEEVADAEPEFAYDGEKYVLRMGNREAVGATPVDALCSMYLKYKEK